MRDLCNSDILYFNMWDVPSSLKGQSQEIFYIL